jgi:hydroxyacylglutathione hydrolase
MTHIHPFTLGLGSSSYLIETPTGLILVDAGLPGQEQVVLKRLHALGQDTLRLIFITHAHIDHYGSAAALRRLTGAPIAIHRADGSAMAQGQTPLGSVRGWGHVGRALLPLLEWYMQPEPTQADVLLEDGDDLRQYGLDAAVFHAPGHTPGSSCLIVEGRTAFAGDLLTISGRPRLQRIYASSWSQLRDSLARLQALELEWVYAGHGTRPLSGAALRRLIADYLQEV